MNINNGTMIINEIRCLYRRYPIYSRYLKFSEGFTLRNQNQMITDFRDIDIEDYLEDMFVTPEQFVVLTAPKTQYKVRYVQACIHDGEIEVELGIEEEGTHLFYKMCSEEECYRIFLDFYENRLVPKMEEYKPVEF